MFEGLAASLHSTFPSLLPDEFCVPCFLEGFAKGLTFGLAALVGVALLPEEAAVLATYALLAVGGEGLAKLGASWHTMSPQQKSQACGELLGGAVAGGAGKGGFDLPAPQLAALQSANGAAALDPVMVWSAVPVGGTTSAGVTAGVAGTGGAALMSGGEAGGEDDAGSTTPSGQPGGTPTGRRTEIDENANAEERRSLERENESADVLAGKGYRVEQNPNLPGLKKPDYLVEGRVFDNYAPKEGTPPQNIVRTIDTKVGQGQTDRVVLNMNDSDVSSEALQQQLSAHPVPGLQEVLVVKDGRVSSLWPM